MTVNTVIRTLRHWRKKALLLSLLILLVTSLMFSQEKTVVTPRTLIPAVSVTRSSAALPWTKERADFRFLSSKVSLPPGKIPRNAQALVVTTIVDTGAGSFRQAILDADSIPGVDLITFDIPGPGVHTIEPIIKLPNITDPVLIDGTSQPGFNGTPLIELSGVNLGGFDALDVFANDCVIKGLVIDRVPAGSGIVLYGDANTIAGNYFGLDPSGTNAPGIAFNGVIMFGLDNRVGGTLTENRNYFAGIGSPAIAISGSAATGNSVEGNYIGTDVTGTVKLGTQTEGVILKTGPWHNTIGGSVAGARNVIAGSSLASGISIVGPGTHGNVVLGNYIGTDPTGLKAFGNSGNGIFVSGADSTVIGGLAFGAGNIICGNGFPGIYIDSTADSTQILGNSIGLGPNGLTPLPNSKGIVINGSSGNRIDGNTITGNTLHGVEIRNQGATGNILVGNLIGVSPLAGILVGNNGHGVLVNASNNVIGGPNAGDANTIAGNFGAGISVESGQKNLISRNAIYSNYGLGIDLAPGGVNPNDTLDADTWGERHAELSGARLAQEAWGVDGRLRPSGHCAGWKFHGRILRRLGGCLALRTGTSIPGIDHGSNRSAGHRPILGVAPCCGFTKGGGYCDCDRRGRKHFGVFP